LITIQYCLHRKSGMSPQDFSAYWRGPHAELVRALAERLGIVRYVQNHAALPEAAAQMQGMRGSAEPFDGVAAISFAGPEALARGNIDATAADAQRLLADDEAQFIDIARSVILFTTTHEVIA
jgi:hypothetical protein